MHASIGKFYEKNKLKIINFFFNYRIFIDNTKKYKYGRFTNENAGSL